MKNKKRIIPILGVSLVTSCAAFLVWMQSSDMSQTTKDVTETTQKAVDYQKIAQEIKDNKEPIVVGKVFDNGYLQKHGDHYHFVYGKVPEGAIYEEDFKHVVTDNYQFNPQDVVSENDLGYVVKHGDHYHFIYKNKQQGLINPVHNVADDHYIFNPTDIVSETKEGYVVKHGDHYHFVFKDKHVAEDEVVAEKHVPSYLHHEDHNITTIRQSDIIEETEEGYVVKHDDHFHFIYKKDLTQPIIADNHDHGHGHEYEHEHDHADNDVLHYETETADDVPLHASEQSLEAKKAYVAKIYGVDSETIRVTDEFFIFNDPGHAYDPTHIHPYAVRINSLIIPEVTGIPEIDFENELLALAKRINKAPHTILVDNNRFVLNHGNHNHYVYIQATNGIQSYYENKLPTITGDYVTGEFSKETVLSKVEDMRHVAKEMFKDDPLGYRRVERALEAFVSDLQFVSNSTQGYLNMLEKFHATHIDPTQNAPQKDSEPTNPLYGELVDTLKNLNVEKYHFEKQTLLDALKTAVDTGNQVALDRVAVTVKELQRIADLPSVMVSEMAYLDYFLKHLENETLTLEQREEVSELILEVFKTTTRHKERQFTFYELTPRLIATKATILHQKEQNVTQEIEIGENYVTLHTQASSPRVPKPYRLEISDLVNEMRTFIMDLNMATPDVLNEGFKDPILMTPIGPTAIGVASGAVSEDSEQPIEETETASLEETPVVNETDTEHTAPPVNEASSEEPVNDMNISDDKKEQFDDTVLNETNVDDAQE